MDGTFTEVGQHNTFRSFVFHQSREQVDLVVVDYRGNMVDVENCVQIISAELRDVEELLDGFSAFFVKVLQLPF